MGAVCVHSWVYGMQPSLQKATVSEFLLPSIWYLRCFEPGMLSMQTRNCSVCPISKIVLGVNLTPPPLCLQRQIWFLICFICIAFWPKDIYSTQDCSSAGQNCWIGCVCREQIVCCARQKTFWQARVEGDLFKFSTDLWLCMVPFPAVLGNETEWTLF